MFKRILVAVDGSPASSAGLHSAVALAADQRAALIALHVIDDGSLPINFEGALYPPSYVDAYFEAMAAIGRKILDRTLKLARASRVQIDCVLVRSQGNTVAEAIVEQSRKLKADIIVLGTHGRRGLKRVLMGSDAEQVVREAGIPVLLVRDEGRKRKRKPPAKARAPVKTPRSRSVEKDQGARRGRGVQ